jgi:hypothetical protein
VEAMPPPTVYSNTAKYPAASTPGGLAKDQRATPGASRRAPARDAGR